MTSKVKWTAIVLTCAKKEWGTTLQKGKMYILVVHVLSYLFHPGVIVWSWSWSYGSWIYNYLCNQCLSPLMLVVRIPLRRGVLDTILCDKVCQWLATGQMFSPIHFLFTKWIMQMLIYFFAIHLIVKIILKHVFFGAIKMKKVVSVSALKWIVRYIYYWNLHFLNNIIIIKTNAILPQTILFAPRDFKWNYLPSYFFEFEHSSWWLFRKQVTCTKWDTLSIFYCQTITDNGSDTSYKLTRSSQDIFLHLY
jgi:hypothetical protein